ncbi:T9SS type A sorting domain-containing protein [bacterium]|nr:T9SS type A sorting domain-containing protein [bacterium]
MRVQIISLLLMAVCIFGADSLNIGLEYYLPTTPLRGVATGENSIIAFGKAPTAYSIQYLCGGSAVILDSVSWSGSSIPVGTNLAGRWISVEDGVAYLSDWTRGLHVIDISDPLDIVDLGSLSLSGQARSVYPIGESLFVAANTDGIHLVDISSPSTPFALLNYEVGGLAMDVAVSDASIMFVAEDPTGISVWNLASPLEPITFEDIPGTITGLDFAGTDTILIASDFEGSVNIVVLDSTFELEVVNTIPVGDDYVFKSIYDEGLLIVAAGESGLWVFQLDSDGVSVVDSGFYSLDGSNFVDVCLFGDIVVAADAEGGIFFFDISYFRDNISESSSRPVSLVINSQPNPFNSAVKISVDFSSRENENPLIQIFDLSGRRIDIISSISRNLFQYKRDFSSSSENNRVNEYIWYPSENVTSGIYLILAQIGDITRTKKIILLK